MEWVVAGTKAISAILGAALALIFKMPRTLSELLARATFSIIAGFLFGEPVRTEYLHWPDRFENVMGATALVAAVSWFVAPAFIKLVQGIASLKPK